MHVDLTKLYDVFIVVGIEGWGKEMWRRGNSLRAININLLNKDVTREYLKNIQYESVSIRIYK